MPCELFLSFSSRDQDVANLIVDDVERHSGWRFFQCTRPDDNPAGGNWSATLAGQLSDCLAMVLIHSEHARASDYVLREIEMAVGIRKPIVAIRLDDAPWAPGADYLMRTIQAPIVPRERLSAYLPHLRRAIGRLLPSALALPLDSIADRQLKVDAVRHLARKVAGEAQSVHLYGLGIKLDGLDALFVASPCLAGRIWEELCAGLRRMADFTHGEQSGLALLPVIAKEDIILLVRIASTDQSEDECRRSMAAIQDDLVRFLVGRGLNPMVTTSDLRLEALASGDDVERIADYLTDLGKKPSRPGLVQKPLRPCGSAQPRPPDVAQEAEFVMEGEPVVSREKVLQESRPIEIADDRSPDRDSTIKTTGNPEALREVLRSLARAKNALPRTLPLALTGSAAWRHFEAIGAQERSLP